MRASVIKRLAEAGEASKSELNPTQTFIGWVNGKAISWYRGQYAACGIMVDAAEEIPTCAIAARQFRDLMTGLFEDDKEIKLTSVRNSLVVATGRRRATFRFEGEPDFTEYWRRLEMIQDKGVLVDREVFTREISIASEIVASSLSMPILTGIRLAAGADRVGIQSANGMSLMFQSAIPAVTGDVRASVVVPTAEFKSALSTMRGKDLHLIIDARSVILRSADAFFVLPVMSGTWPSLQHVISSLVFADEVTLPSGIIRDVSTAVRIYTADSDVRFSPTERNEVIISTMESEAGQFVEAIAGKLSREYRFDVADLAIAAKIADGDVTMAVGPSMARISTLDRTLYVQQRFVA